VSLQRSWIVVSYLTREGGVSEEKCGISLCQAPLLPSSAEQPAIQIVLLSRNICK
jgi:hypothetical protein